MQPSCNLAPEPADLLTLSITAVHLWLQTVRDLHWTRYICLWEGLTSTEESDKHSAKDAAMTDRDEELTLVWPDSNPSYARRQFVDREMPSRRIL